MMPNCDSRDRFLVEIKMANANAKYFKVNLILIHVSTPIGVQEKESIMSVKY